LKVVYVSFGKVIDSRARGQSGVVIDGDPIKEWIG